MNLFNFNQRYNLKLYEISAIASAIVMISGLFWYIWLVYLGKIQTVAASWIVSTTALTLSLITYATSPKATMLGGTLNAASAFAVGMTLVAVYMRAKFDRKKIEFTRAHIKYLKASLGIMILWIVIK